MMPSPLAPLSQPTYDSERHNVYIYSLGRECSKQNPPQAIPEEMTPS